MLGRRSQFLYKLTTTEQVFKLISKRTSPEGGREFSEKYYIRLSASRHGLFLILKFVFESEHRAAMVRWNTAHVEALACRRYISGTRTLVTKISDRQYD